MRMRRLRDGDDGDARRVWRRLMSGGGGGGGDGRSGGGSWRILRHIRAKWRVFNDDDSSLISVLRRFQAQQQKDFDARLQRKFIHFHFASARLVFAAVVAVAIFGVASLGGANGCIRC